VLTEENKAYLKEILMQNMSEYTGQIHERFVDFSEIKERSFDYLDNASFETNNQMSSRITERQGNMIRKIKFALEKLNTGSYGICEECGEGISHQRLMARPMAILCIDCKREQELMENKRKP
jgi:DnaK suppressor protein